MDIQLDIHLDIHVFVTNVCLSQGSVTIANVRLLVQGKMRKFLRGLKKPILKALRMQLDAGARRLATSGLRLAQGEGGLGGLSGWRSEPLSPPVLWSSGELRSGLWGSGGLNSEVLRSDYLRSEVLQSELPSSNELPDRYRIRVSRT